MYVIFTDTDCNVTPELAEELGIKLIYMPYSIDGVEYMPYTKGVEFDYHSYYDMLRNGTLPSTSAINPFQYREYFEEYFKQGIDILYLTLSSKMSGTLNAMKIAVQELQEEYPNVRFEAFDTLAIANGSINLILEACELYKQGKSMDEVLDYCKNNVMKHACYFIVEDLEFMKRSGRVSGFAASIGSLMSIHPIMRMCEDGALRVYAKTMGRRKTFELLVNTVEKLQEDFANHLVTFCHCDCLDIVNELIEILKKKFGEFRYLIQAANPTIGAHCGPSSFAICFHSKQR